MRDRLIANPSWRHPNKEGELPNRKPDPILAVIKAAVATDRADGEAMIRLDEASERFEAKYGHYHEPCCMPKRVRQAWTKTIKPLERADKKTSAAFRKALGELPDTTPTTLAGLAALFAGLNDNQSLRESFFSHEEYAERFVATLAKATARISTQT
jgi:hypothetical protein